MKEIFVTFNRVFNSKQKTYTGILFVMILVGAVLETLGVSSIIPLVTAIISPNVLNDNILVASLCEKLNIANSNELIIYCIVLIIVLFVTKNLYMFILNYVQYKFIYDNQFEMTIALLRIFMRKPFEYYLNTNFNYIKRVITADANSLCALLLNIIKLFTEFIIFAFLCVLLFAVDWKMTLFIGLILGITSLFLTTVLKPMLNKAGESTKKYAVEADKWFYQAFNGIKELKILRKEEFFVEKYYTFYRKYLNALKINNIFSNLPQLFIETVFVSGMMLFMLVIVLNGNDLNDIIPQISAFAVAAIRLMPSANRMNTYINGITYYKPYLYDINKSIDENWKYKNLINTKYEESNSDLTFIDKIELENIFFKYSNSGKYILDDVSLSIPIGSSVAIIGESGSGKTTIVDLLLGILDAEKGSITIDGKDVFLNYGEWIKHIGYIPQVIYLIDDTIRNNVAFGLPKDEIKEELVWKALDEAQISQFVRELPQGLDTIVGDRGVRISGGQRQRLGIARALYLNPDILVFDEATSALDNETENAIMESINSFKGNKTIIIIAHRLETIKSCDITYRVMNGKVIRE